MSDTKKSDDAKTATPPKIEISQGAELLRSLSKPVVSVLSVVFPYFVRCCRLAYGFYKKLPVDESTVLIGSIFCFFGGLYPAVFAAIQAAKYGGMMTFLDAVSDITDEALVVIEASKKDDELDEDNNGKKDVDEIDAKTLFLRKTNLIITKINPKKVDDALQAIYTVWISVISVLTVRFARTISLALAISDFVKRPVNRYVSPTIQMAIPDKYDKWVPVILGWIIKSIAMSIAWYIQTIISAFTSACQGGLMISQSLLRILARKKMTFGGIIPSNPDDTHVDEIVSYVLAALGFYFQYSIGFDVPFPFNLLLFPFEIAEYYIRWTITVVD